jgi:hypothetical protein
VLAEIARETVRRNGLQDLVNVFLCHTSDLDAGFMQRTFGGRADACVAELLDTAFFGEGLHDSMQHARQCLLSESPAMIVPRRARLYVQAWGGDVLGRGAEVGGVLLSCGLRAGRLEQLCRGNHAGSTIQMHPLIRSGRAFPISEAVVAFEVDLLSLSSSDSVTISLPVTRSGAVTALVMFWDSFCEEREDELMLSTAMFDAGGHLQVPSADHWRQMVFCQQPAARAAAESGGCCCIKVRCRHNEDDFWAGFTGPEVPGARVCKRAKVESGHSEQPLMDSEQRPICTCGLHSCSSIWRIMQLNSPQHEHLIAASQDQAKAAVASTHMNNNSEINSNLFIVLGDSLLLAPAIMLPIFQTLSTHSIALPEERGCVAIIVACTSTISMMYTQDLIRANFSNDFVDEYVSFIVLACLSGENTAAVGGDSDGSGSDAAEGDHLDWMKHLRAVVEQQAALLPGSRRGTTTTTTSSSGCASYESTVFVEPYFQALQQEWGLEHFLALCDILKVLNPTLMSPSAHAQPSRFCCSVDTVEIWCSFFSSQSLWDEYMAEIGDVEGIDMSAINDLMVDVAVSDTEVTSSQLSQWSTSIFGQSCVATLSVEGCLEGAEEDSSFLLSHRHAPPAGPTEEEAESRPLYLHGLAFWTVFKSSTHPDTINISSHPIDHPETMQAFRCFDKAYDLKTFCNYEINVNLSVGICKHQNSFKVSLL